MTAQIGADLPHWPAAVRLPCAVAYSGGADSSMLLAWLVANGCTQDALAIHVHHGLQKDADFFEYHARKTCAKLKIRLKTVRLHAEPFAGEGAESQARLQRYLVLLELAKKNGCKSILLGHHRNDYDESVMMGLMSGSMAGICGFPPYWQTGKMTWLRVFFDQQSSWLKSKMAEQNWDWVEDFSNQDIDFLRNKIRLERGVEKMNFSTLGHKASDFLHDYYCLALRF